MKKKSWLFLIYCVVIICGIALFLVFYNPDSNTNSINSNTQLNETSTESSNETGQSSTYNPKESDLETVYTIEITSLKFIDSMAKASIQEFKNNTIELNLADGYIGISFDYVIKSSSLQSCSQDLTISIDNENIAKVKSTTNPIRLNNLNAGETTIFMENTSLKTSLTINLKIN